MKRDRLHLCSLWMSVKVLWPLIERSGLPNGRSIESNVPGREWTGEAYKSF